MKILHISTFDKGGAASSCLRLHESLLKTEIESKVLVKVKKKEIPYVFEYQKNDFALKYFKTLLRVGYRLGLNSHPDLPPKDEESKSIFKLDFKTFEFFATPNSDCDLDNHQLVIEADLIHLHWVAGFLDYSTFFKNIKKPVIYTLHDMAPFTGGNHFSEFCYSIGNQGEINRIPLTEKQEKILLGYESEKVKALTENTLKRIVAPSKWLESISKSSKIFSKIPHSVIPYGIDSTIFVSIEKGQAREKLRLPIDKKILLFVSDSIWNTRKGFFILEKALAHLDQSDILLCAIGKKSEEFPSHVFYGGEITDQSKISLFYSAADAFILPSLEDNLPNTLLESLMCGTPVLGFSVGGIKETIVNGFNGLISEDISVSGLANLILEFLSHSAEYDGHAIRNEAITKFDSKIQAIMYKELYQNILAAK